MSGYSERDSRGRGEERDKNPSKRREPLVPVEREMRLLKRRGTWEKREEIEIPRAAETGISNVARGAFFGGQRGRGGGIRGGEKTVRILREFH